MIYFFIVVVVVAAAAAGPGFGSCYEFDVSPAHSLIVEF